MASKTNTGAVTLAPEAVVTQTAATEVITPVDPFVQGILEKVNEAVSDPNVQVTVSKVTRNIPAKVRNVLYTVGIVAGAVGTFGTAIVGLFTGEVALYIGTASSLALTLQSTLSKLNLSKTADDIADEVAA